MATTHLTYSDYARFAHMSDEKLARDCSAQAFHASGPGGQGVNTADSAVRMAHVPTGITVTSRESRSQLQNREKCLEKIRAELERRSHRPRKRIKTKPTAASRKRRLASKHFNALKKANRRRVTGDE